MRVWRNAVLNMGLTSFDVHANPAIEADKSFSFKNIHGKCKTPVKQQNLCPKCNKVLEAVEIVSGIEYPKGEFIPVTEDEKSSTYAKTKNLIDIQKFVHEDMLNEMLYDSPYWLFPGKRGKAEEAYATMKVLMTTNHWLGLGSVAFTEKEHPCALVAVEGGLVLWMLHHPSQLRLPDWQLPQPSKLGLKQLGGLMHDMVEPIEDGDFETPTRVLKKNLVDLKIGGHTISPVKQAEATAVPDWLDSIKDSVKLVQERKKARTKAKVK